MLEMLKEEGIEFPGISNRETMERKKQKVEEYLKYSFKHGTLTIDD